MSEHLPLALGRFEVFLVNVIGDPPFAELLSDLLALDVVLSELGLGVGQVLRPCGLIGVGFLLPPNRCLDIPGLGKHLDHGHPNPSVDLSNGPHGQSASTAFAWPPSTTTDVVPERPLVPRTRAN